MDWDAAIEIIDWANKRAAPGAAAADAPAALRLLLGASDADAAERGYQRLSELGISEFIEAHEVAEPITAVVLLALRAPLDASALASALVWLEDAWMSFAAPSEEDLGNEDLHDRIRAGILGQLDAVRALLSHPREEVATNARAVIARCEADRDGAQGLPGASVGAAGLVVGRLGGHGVGEA
jgi:hypothetical protein